MDWNCALTEERLSDVLDRTLAADQMAAFSAHAADCKRCARLVGQVDGLVTRMQRLPLVEEPLFLASKIVAATRGVLTRERNAKGWFVWLPAISPTRLAMGLVTVAASFLIVFHALSTRPHKIAFSPANLYRSANRHAHLTYARGVRFVNDLRVVYVIQSRLSSEPQPVSEPASAPLTEPNSTPGQRPPDSDARPQSQPFPPTGHRATQDTAQLAILVVSGGSRNPLNEPSRSLP